MKRLIYILFALAFWNAGQLRAEGTETEEKTKENAFSMSVQIRPRAEYRNGVLFPRDKGEAAAGFINNRARLSMNYERENLSIGLSAQHVGVWGQDPQIDKNGRFILNEAWAQLNFGQGFFAKIGRQSFVYDDERLLGALDWNVAGRYHDALKLGYENPNNRLHLLFAFNQNDEKTIGGTYYASGGQPYKTMQTLWYEHTFTSDFRASFLAMNIGIDPASEEEKADTKYMQTFGTNLYYRPGIWTFGGTFYYQSGKTVADRDVSAFMWAVNAACQLHPKWKVGIGSDYLSGSGDKTKGTYKAFDPLYGTHHKFYGAMDYFYASKFVDSNMNPGLWDNQVSVAYKPSKRVNLSLAYHYFSITSDINSGSGREAGRGLGSELDFQIDWQIMKDVKLSAGYSTMLAGDTMELVKGGDPSSWQDWGWLSININPRVFHIKW